MSRPKLFVGSSSEGHDIAQSVQVNLDRVCEVKLWDQGPFGLSQGRLESLVRVADEYDFAVLVLTADDLNISRGTARLAARDNVLFELGLFIGALGRDRTFILCNGADLPVLPSDLAGVDPVTFIPHADGNLEATLGAPCTKFQHAIERLGIRENKGLRNHQKDTQDVAGWLLSPGDGDEVGHKQTVSGVVCGLPPGAEAWILIQPSFDRTYWPQFSALVDRKGPFEEEVWFGRSGKDFGKRYILLLVMAPPDASMRFRDFPGADASEGMAELPSDVVTLARAVVTRRVPTI